MSGTRTKRIILGCCLAGGLGGAVAAWYVYCVWPAHREQLAAWPHWDQLRGLATCVGWAAVVLLVACACWLVHFLFQKKRRERFADAAARLRLNYSAKALPSLHRLQTLDILREMPAPMTLP